MECGAWVERLHIPVKNTYALLPDGQILLLPLRFGLFLGAQVCYVMALAKPLDIESSWENAMFVVRSIERQN
jgi:hypothetical protein